MTSARLSLHVPEPTVRPGGSPDFSHVGIAEAGEVPRPPVDVSPSDIRNFAYTMIRALDDQGEAVGDWAGALDPDELRKGLRDMMLTRAFDARMLLSQRQGKTSFYITCLGEEAIATAHRKALADGDMCFPTYRQQGLLIAYGWPIVDMMCRWLSFQRPLFRSSELAIEGDKSGRLLAICQHFSASTYLSGNAAQDYLDTGLFRDAGISVEWQNFNHPTYPQLHGDFIPCLSALDLVLNVGFNSNSVLRGNA